MMYLMLKVYNYLEGDAFCSRIQLYVGALYGRDSDNMVKIDN